MAGMQVDFGELGNHLVEAVGFFEFGDFLFEPKALKNFLDVLGKSFDVVREVLADVVRIALEFAKVERTVIKARCNYMEEKKNPPAGGIELTF